jgi:hypothetical protein
MRAGGDGQDKAPLVFHAARSSAALDHHSQNSQIMAGLIYQIPLSGAYCGHD